MAMRIWHENLIAKLCRQHLLAMWREGLGAYKIITENKKGYRNHPAVKEFDNAPMVLWDRLVQVRVEMINRNYNPKSMPPVTAPLPTSVWEQQPLVKPWQTLEEQIAILKQKGCNCQI